jgi:hypothetical protein
VFEHIEHGGVAGLPHLRILSVCGFLLRFQVPGNNGALSWLG